MTWVKHNIRLSPAQDRTLVGYAEQRGLTRYKMLGRVVDHGLAAVENGINAPSDMREIADEIAAIRPARPRRPRRPGPYRRARHDPR